MWRSMQQISRLDHVKMYKRGRTSHSLPLWDNNRENICWMDRSSLSNLRPLCSCSSSLWGCQCFTMPPPSFVSQQNAIMSVLKCFQQTSEYLICKPCNFHLRCLISEINSTISSNMVPAKCCRCTNTNVLAGKWPPSSQEAVWSFPSADASGLCFQWITFYSDGDPFFPLFVSTSF